MLQAGRAVFVGARQDNENNAQPSRPSQDILLHNFVHSCALCRGFPLPWMLLAILVFWLIQTFLLPRGGGRA